MLESRTFRVVFVDTLDPKLNIDYLGGRARRFCNQ